MSQTVLPYLESELRSLAAASAPQDVALRRRAVRFVSIVAISSAGLATTAGVTAAFDVWSVSTTNSGGLCVTVAGSGTCTDNPHQIENGQTFFTEHGPDRVLSSDGRFNRVEPSSTTGTARGVAPGGVVLVNVISRNGELLASAVPESGRYSVALPPQGSGATLQFVSRDGEVKAEQQLP